MDKISLSNLIIALSKNIDPSTGEFFDAMLYKDPEVLQAITLFITNALNPQSTSSITSPSQTELPKYNWPEDEIYEKLRKWRYDIAFAKNLPAYYIFSNKYLQEISQSHIHCKEDLLSIPGIGPQKYSIYGDDIFKILQPYIEKLNKEQLSSEKTTCQLLHSPHLPEPPMQLSCEKCMLYRREDCFGNSNPETCEFFQSAIDISPEELEVWKSIETTIDRIRRTGHGFK